MKCYSEERKSAAIAKMMPPENMSVPELSEQTGISLQTLYTWRQKASEKGLTRPAVSEKRLALTSNGNIRYQLKTPYRDGTTHFIFQPLDFIAKLAALVPKPRVNLTRFHGVLAPNSKFRVRVTPAKRGRGRKRHQPTGDNWLDKAPAERHAAMTWMQRLKRVFNIDIETCERCAGRVRSGQVRIIACIEDPAVIENANSTSKGIVSICRKRLHCPDCCRSLMTRMGVGVIALGMVMQIPRMSVRGTKRPFSYNPLI